MTSTHGTLKLRPDGKVLFVEIDAPPLNMLGPELVGDLVELIQVLDQGAPYSVVVFSSANPNFFIAHVDTTKIKEYRAAAAALTGEPSIALLFRRLSKTKAVTIAQIEGRVRGAGSEFIMACDLRFGARETAIFNQNEGGMGVLPGGGATQYLSRLMGRGRALEVLLTADDYSADVAELYGWINRAIPQAGIADFISKLAHRIARFPARGLQEIKARMNELTLAPDDAFRHDSDAFLQGLQDPSAQAAVKHAVEKGFGTSEQAELTLGALLGEFE
ncbi:Enoyl-CoA hydratase/carnithine racemase [Granulicella rosea]|uniref:Enoyl-CoA hydratase/carnithine racemase n=1 Tax=Granulicella rosea TaxID=474952 RepID=A0A239EI46_9BACT|nr:enoyl-CoA hydratase/isomerase family protein [Granulicella rosea]SNS44325.1 Enoyl-CoA hydratase/carnithine racemase [Granulicella rosea]